MSSGFCSPKKSVVFLAKQGAAFCGPVQGQSKLLSPLIFHCLIHLTSGDVMAQEWLYIDSAFRICIRNTSGFRRSSSLFVFYMEHLFVVLWFFIAFLLVCIRIKLHMILS